jgi:hypothetical protein
MEISLQLLVARYDYHHLHVCKDYSTKLLLFCSSLPLLPSASENFIVCCTIVVS